MQTWWLKSLFCLTIVCCVYCMQNIDNGLKLGVQPDLSNKVDIQDNQTSLLANDQHISQVNTEGNQVDQQVLPVNDHLMPQTNTSGNGKALPVNDQQLPQANTSNNQVYQQVLAVKDQLIPQANSSGKGQSLSGKDQLIPLANSTGNGQSLSVNDQLIPQTNSSSNQVFQQVSPVNDQLIPKADTTGDKISQVGQSYAEIDQQQNQVNPIKYPVSQEVNKSSQINSMFQPQLKDELQQVNPTVQLNNSASQDTSGAKQNPLVNQTSKEPNQMVEFQKLQSSNNFGKVTTPQNTDVGLSQSPSLQDKLQGTINTQYGSRSTTIKPRSSSTMFARLYGISLTSSIQRSTSRPFNQHSSSRPSVQQSTSRPSVQQSTSRPFNQRSTSRPSVQQSTSRPFDQQSTSRPSVQQSTSRPFDQQSTSRPFNQQSSSRPFDQQSTSRPFDQQSTSRPFDQQSTSRLSVQQSTSRPSVQQSTKSPYFIGTQSVFTSGSGYSGTSQAPKGIIDNDYLLEWDDTGEKNDDDNDDEWDDNDRLWNDDVNLDVDKNDGGRFDDDWFGENEDRDRGGNDWTGDSDDGDRGGNDWMVDSGSLGKQDDRTDGEENKVNDEDLEEETFNSVADKTGDFWDEPMYNKNPFIKDKFVSNKYQPKSFNETNSMMGFYSWVLCVTILLMIVFVLFTQQRPRCGILTGHRRIVSLPGSAEEGNSLMKNIYT